MDDACVFCKIVAGGIPSVRVHEDSNVLAFIDIGPIIKGHTLVIPKAHFPDLPSLPDDLLATMAAVVRRVAAAQIKALGADGVNVHQSNGACAGQVVPHVHFHVIPRFKDDGHRWNWKATSYGSPAEMQEMADRIRRGL